MITAWLALALQVAGAPLTADGLTIGAIGRQALPSTGCAAYLWTTGAEHALLAMAVAAPASLRLSIDGVTSDYARTAQQGPGELGFAGTTEYSGGTIAVTLDMTIAVSADLTNGAVVPAATLRIDRTGHDSIVVPVAGLIGCN